MLLPDINVWLAIGFGMHEHHSVAKKWFDAISDGGCSFCRMTQQGFLRLATNPKVLEDAVAPADAWRLATQGQRIDRILAMRLPVDHAVSRAE